MPLRVHTVVISVQHKEDMPLEAMRVALRDQVAKVCEKCRDLHLCAKCR